MNIRISSDGKTHAFFYFTARPPTFQSHEGLDGLQKMTRSGLVKIRHFARSNRIEFLASLGTTSNVIMGKHQKLLHGEKRT
jgi:hypothetical protein